MSFQNTVESNIKLEKYPMTMAIMMTSDNDDNEDDVLYTGKIMTMAVASRGGGGGARGAVAAPVKKLPLKNNRNQNTYLNILGV